jgi:hypothetical protein
MHIYAPGDTWLPGEFPAILAIGDSWFWYPQNNILQAVTQHPDLKDPYRIIQMLGYNGAMINQYVGSGKYAAEFQRELRPEACQYYSAVMISGGGNDAVDYRLALKADCTGLTQAADCIAAEGLDGLVRDISGSLGLMIHDIAWAFGKQNRMADVFIHGYDYPLPDGRGFALAGLNVAGPWLKPALDGARVAGDMTLRTAICRLLIDELNATFARFDNPGQGIHYIDSRGVLRQDADYMQDWDNELHPTVAGFRQIVDQRWMPVLRLAGYAQPSPAASTAALSRRPRPRAQGGSGRSLPSASQPRTTR